MNGSLRDKNKKMFENIVDEIQMEVPLMKSIKIELPRNNLLCIILMIVLNWTFFLTLVRVISLERE